MRRSFKPAGVLALAVGGTASAFALAACCALPLLLVGAGLSPYWLAPAALWGERLGSWLTIFSVIALGSAVILLWRSARTCAPGSLCSRRWFIWTVAAIAAAGLVLLVLAQVYA
jgi:mercuric ion transport protein